MSRPAEAESEFIELVRARYEPAGDMPYEEEQDLLFLLNAPAQYEAEPQMLDYAKKHPQATMRELITYFESFVPDGLPPCAASWDDDEDDE